MLVISTVIYFHFQYTMWSNNINHFEKYLFIRGFIIEESKNYKKKKPPTNTPIPSPQKNPLTSLRAEKRCFPLFLEEQQSICHPCCFCQLCSAGNGSLQFNIITWEISFWWKCICFFTFLKQSASYFVSLTRITYLADCTENKIDKKSSYSISYHLSFYEFIVILYTKMHSVHT